MRLLWTDDPCPTPSWEVPQDNSEALIRVVDQCIRTLVGLEIEEKGRTFHLGVTPLAVAHGLLAMGEAFFFRGTQRYVMSLTPDGGTRLCMIRRGDYEVACSLVDGLAQAPKAMVLPLQTLLESVVDLLGYWRRQALDTIDETHTRTRALFNLATMHLEALDDLIVLAKQGPKNSPLSFLPDGRPHVNVSSPPTFETLFKQIAGEAFPDPLSDYDHRNRATMTCGLSFNADTPVPNNLRDWLNISEKKSTNSAFLRIERAQVLAARWCDRRLVLFEDRFVPERWPSFWRSEWALRRLKFLWKEGPHFKDGLIASYGVFEHGVVRQLCD
jgi:hypothetical protein